jgi:5'-methylthioadenosine phosphorylase
MKIGLIGGSGLYNIKGLNFVEQIELNTDYGKPSSSYKVFNRGSVNYYFLARHGYKHSIPPHKINYRANIEGFKKLGIDKILSFCAVGAINRDYSIRDIIIPENAIDFTSGRQATFYETIPVYHIDITEPFCGILREKVIEYYAKTGRKIVDNAVYVCTNGPRLETAAEIKMFEILGGDIVGMTLFPECVLAREKEICYINVSVVTNYAAGISKNKLTTVEVKENMSKINEDICDLIYNMADFLDKLKSCNICPKALSGTRVGDNK